MYYWKRILGFYRRVPYRRSKLSRVSSISDDDSLNMIKGALHHSELIVGIDCTRTNEQRGIISFNCNSLHQITDDVQNPYEDIMSMLGRWTLSPTDKEKQISCYGFGDAITLDESVFNFNPENEHCLGFDGVLSRYRQRVPDLRLADHKTFSPIIKKAIEIADKNQGKQHILMIISDGPIYRCDSAEHGQLCSHEQDTIDAIKNAMSRNYPLSIILIGVGDRSGEMIPFFKTNLSRRDFEKIQIVDYTKCMSNDAPLPRKEVDFALAAMKKLSVPNKVIGG